MRTASVPAWSTAHSASPPPVMTKGSLTPEAIYAVTGEPARFVPGDGNGRAVNDDSFGIALSAFIGEELGTTAAPNPINPRFPHLAAGNRDDLRRSPTCPDYVRRGRRAHKPPGIRAVH